MQTAPLRAKTQRNDACPCGSGKKYKKCCGQAGSEESPGPARPREADVGAQSAQPRTEPISANELQQVVALFNAGRYAELEAKARELTARDSASGLAWKVLGTALGMQGKDALLALQRAAQLLPRDAESHNNLGNALRGLGQLEEAVASCRRALELEPTFAEAHNNLGNALRGLGQLEAAVAACRWALKLKPNFAEAHNNLGNALLELDQPEEAAASYGLALKLKPHYAEAHSNLGNALRELDQLEEAATSCRRALELKPHYAEAHSNLGHALLELGQLDEAAVSCRRALEVKPDFAEAHNNLGNVLLKLGEHDEALASCRRALEIKADFAEAHNNLGNVLLGLGRPDEALASCRHALEISPDLAEAHNNLGNVLLKLGKPDAAVASYRRALEITPQSAEVHNNLGNALTAIALNPYYAVANPNRGDAPEASEPWQAALASYDRAIALSPGYAEAYTNRANGLVEFGQWDAAQANYERAIAVNPNYAGGRYSRSMLMLLRGEFDEGWIEHEWRWKNDNGSYKVDRHLVQRLWLGKEPIAGKTILLYGEQGLGDTLHFCRYVKSVADLGARVILDVQKPLVSLLETLEGASQIVARGGTVPDFDYQCPLMSLPLAFKTHLATIPSSARYLTIDAAKVAQWQAKLGEKTTARVGLVWRGNPKYQDDYKRSIPLADLSRHLPEGPQYVSLHKDVSETDRQLLQSSGIAQFADDLHDFSDTAALCDCMDVVVSVDTSVAHLSGALGKNTWILLPFAPDWRWLLDRDDSPWYPTVSLYRQQSGRDWGGVLERVKAGLSRPFELRMDHPLCSNHVTRS